MRNLKDSPEENKQERAARISRPQMRALVERRKADPEPVQCGGREMAMKLIEKRLSCTNLRELLRLIPDCFEGIRKIDITIDGACDSAVQRRFSASVAAHPGFGEYIVFDGSGEAADVNIIRKHLTVERTSGTEKIGAIEISSMSEPTLRLRGSDDPGEAAAVFGMITALISRTIDASLDGLTLLATRKSLDDTLRSCGADFVSSGRGFPAILLDIDHFKKVHDTHGHNAGDLVLANVAGILLNTMRGVGGYTMDSIGKYGGEEFLVILQGVQVRDAVVVAERLRKAISEHGFALSTSTKIGITCSFGVADTADLGIEATRLSAEEVADAIIALADSRMYHVKETGRDRVEPMPPGALKLVVNS